MNTIFSLLTVCINNSFFKHKVSSTSVSSTFSTTSTVVQTQDDNDTTEEHSHSHLGFDAFDTDLLFDRAASELLADSGGGSAARRPCTPTGTFLSGGETSPLDDLESIDINIGPVLTQTSASSEDENWTRAVRGSDSADGAVGTFQTAPLNRLPPR